jgi:hypothetical protein
MDGVITSLPDADATPVVVTACPLHERRVFIRRDHACPTCVVAPVDCPSADATADNGEWIEAAAFLEFAILVLQRWLRAASAEAPTLSPFVSIDNAADVRAQLFAARERFEALTPEHDALTGLFHAAAALDSFDTSRRRGLLDEIYLRSARVVSLARKHSPAADEINQAWQWAKGGWV